MISAEEMFHWPIVTAEDEEAVISIMRAGIMSGTNITQEFEKEFSAWLGTKYALGTCNGTAAIQEAFYACGVGPGTEVICPSMTYWASAAPAVSLGADVVFADIDPDTLCIDPEDIEHRITDRTRAVIVVHYAGHPAEMDEICAICHKHGVKVIEDVSHAQGSLYKGRKCGTLGDIAAISMMGGKSFAIGEGGMVATNDRKLFESCMAFGHYERIAASRYSSPSEKVAPELERYAGCPLGGVKHRMNQACSAMGRVQLKYYDERTEEIRKAMNYFWDLLADCKSIKAHRPAADSGSTMGGWYSPEGLFRGKDMDAYCEKVRNAGFEGCWPGANTPLHIHPFFAERRKPESLPHSENIAKNAFRIPWFKHFDKEFIEKYAAMYHQEA